MAELGYPQPIHLMTSGGSLASLETAARFPVRLVEFGPGRRRHSGRPASRSSAVSGRILSFDMGGTTAKICLIDDGEPLKARAFEVDRQSRFKKGSGMPVRIPVIEMVEIGAGGGSIARVDALQRILVGPDSAGAEPGPACYGRGGTRGDRHGRRSRHRQDRCGTLRRRQDRDRRRPGGSRAARRCRAQARGHDGRAGRAGRQPRSSTRTWRMPRACMRSSAASPSPSARWWPSAARRPCTPAGLPRSSASARIIVPPDAGVGSAVGFLAAPAAYEIVRSRYMRLSAPSMRTPPTRIVGGHGSRRRARMPRRGGRAAVAVQALGLHALRRPGPRDQVALPDRKLLPSRRRHVPGRVRARVHAGCSPATSPTPRSRS